MLRNIKLPSFIIIGAQKAGTTSLHSALAEHPEIFMSQPKELYFFDVDSNYRRGIDWYASFFNNWTNEKVAGESTPDYLWYDKVPARMAKVVPDAKLIIILRNPVQRAHSAYWYAYCNGDETLTFEEALEEEPIRATQGRSIHGISPYVERGLYVRQINRFLKYYDRTQLLILISEDYRSRPEKILQQVTDFLDVTYDPEYINKAKKITKNVSRMPRSKLLHSYVPFLLKRYHFAGRVLRKANLKGAKYPPMAQDIKKILLDRFKESNTELEELLGRKLELWNQ